MTGSWGYEQRGYVWLVLPHLGLKHRERRLASTFTADYEPLVSGKPCFGEEAGEGGGGVVRCHLNVLCRNACFDRALMRIHATRVAPWKCTARLDSPQRTRSLPRGIVMRQRSLPRPLDIDHLAIVADHGAEAEERTEEAVLDQPENLSEDQHLAAAQPARMERASSSRHGGALRTGDALTIMGLPLSPELAAISLGARTTPLLRYTGRACQCTRGRCQYFVSQ